MKKQSGLVLRLPESVAREVSGYRAQVAKFQRGEIPAAAFRAFLAGMGVYEQRQAGRYAVRVRLGAGLVLPAQLKCIAGLSEAYGDGLLHVTTRQDIQIHGVSLENTAAIQEKLLEAGVSARGSGGNTVRNITACPRSPVCPDAVFDVAPYALAAAEYLLQGENSSGLPRKFKAAFSGCGADCAFASFNDAGFFAHIRDGQKGFAVYAGGGLGANAMPGVLLEEFIAPEKIFETLAALIRLFNRLGDRANRSQARLRYVLKRLGPEAFAAEYQKEREAVRREGVRSPSVPLAAGCLAASAVGPSALAANSAARGTLPWGVLPEKQPGQFTLRLQLPQGNIPAGDLAKAAEIAERFGLGLVAATQQQDLLIPGVLEDSITPARNALKSLSLDVLRPRPKIVACVGAATCKLGICRAPSLAGALEERFQAASIDSPVAIRISGCPNSCGNQALAAIGLEGKAKRHQDRLLPCYDVLAGGKPGEGRAQLAQRIGTVPAKALPEFLAEALARGLTSADELRKLAAAWAELPANVPDDYYVDWGAAAPF